MSYSWYDDRINFTGHGNLSAPMHMKKKKCDYYWKGKGYWCHGYEITPPLIWMPTFDYATPNSVEKSTLEDFMTIQKV